MIGSNVLRDLTVGVYNLIACNPFSFNMEVQLQSMMNKIDIYPSIYSVLIIIMHLGYIHVLTSLSQVDLKHVVIVAYI